MKRVACAAVLTMVLPVVCWGQTPQAAARFVGTWRLVSLEVNGKPDPLRGAHPTGLLYYDAEGNMAAQIMPTRGTRVMWAGTPTPEQAIQAVTGYVAYFGTYTVDAAASTVTHHRKASLNPTEVGRDAVRRYEFDGDDRIILTLVDAPTTRLVWERVSK